MWNGTKILIPAVNFKPYLALNLDEMVTLINFILCPRDLTAQKLFKFKITAICQTEYEYSVLNLCFIDVSY